MTPSDYLEMSTATTVKIITLMYAIDDQRVISRWMTVIDVHEASSDLTRGQSAVPVGLVVADFTNSVGVGEWIQFGEHPVPRTQIFLRHAI